jgi:hypothetical protein
VAAFAIKLRWMSWPERDSDRVGGRHTRRNLMGGSKQRIEWISLDRTAVLHAYGVWDITHDFCNSEQDNGHDRAGMKCVSLYLRLQMATWSSGLGTDSMFMA